MRRKLEAAFILGMLVAAFLVAVAVFLVPGTQAAGDPINCPSSVVVSGNTAATAELVPLVAGKRVRVCGFVLTGAAATTVTLKTGTGANCGSGTTNLTGAMGFGTTTFVTYSGGVAPVLSTPVSQALCWTNSATQQVSGVLTYGQY